jgi:hypothetical protein
MSALYVRIELHGSFKIGAGMGRRQGQRSKISGTRHTIMAASHLPAIIPFPQSAPSRSDPDDTHG